jgi:opacity protein-like surface antigen
MKRFTLAAALVIGSAAAAAACPNVAASGMASDSQTGQALYSPTSYSVVAGGSTDLAACGLGTGYVIDSPDFEFTLSGMDSYNRLNLRVDGECDTVLLVNDSTGNWHFNDDSNGLDPAIDIANPGNGVYDVWVGTYGDSTCQASLTLETF